tara:strand:- start:23782 stop:24483 length:702 start_codon:yes stop_codon:yes gene_type:complete
MKVVFVFTLLAILSTSLQANVSKADLESVRSLRDSSLKDELRRLMSRGQRSMGYKQAKIAMFSKIDNEDGEVCGVYSQYFCVRTKGIPNNSTMNTEHTWPQSKGAVGIAKSDLHHLYPTKSSINSTRSNYPFCNVSRVKWENEASKMGYDSRGTQCFEVPDFHKGNVARAMFYFSVRYNHGISSDEERVLRQWNNLDPVDSDEIKRQKAIENHQNNTNVFVIDPGLIDQIDNF